DRSGQACFTPSDAGTVLMHADNRRIDHLHGGVMRAGECAHDFGRPLAASERSDCNKWCTGRSCPAGRAMAPQIEDPEDAIEDTTVIHAWHAARLVWQHRSLCTRKRTYYAHVEFCRVLTLSGRAQRARREWSHSRCRDEVAHLRLLLDAPDNTK